jgi:hypothetical protein
MRSAVMSNSVVVFRPIKFTNPNHPSSKFTSPSAVALSHPSCSHGTPPLPRPLLWLPCSRLQTSMLPVTMLLSPYRATISAIVVLQLDLRACRPVPRPSGHRRGCCTLRLKCWTHLSTGGSGIWATIIFLTCWSPHLFSSLHISLSPVISVAPTLSSSLSGVQPHGGAIHETGTSSGHVDDAAACRD